MPEKNVMEQYDDSYQKLRLFCVKNKKRFYTALAEAIELYLKENK